MLFQEILAYFYEKFENYDWHAKQANVIASPLNSSQWIISH